MDAGDFAIGGYESGDLPDLAAIERDSFSCPWTENAFRQELACPISRILVARNGRSPERPVAGYLINWHVAGEFHLQKIAVKREYRRRGLASCLLGTALVQAHREGCRCATLEVRRSNPEALGLYKKFGFVVTGVRPKYYDDNGEDALIMWADLHPPGRSGETADAQTEVIDRDG